MNMQTSFMHPPFGFSLFCLRSVAPKLACKDRVTGLIMQPMRRGQIYWGAMPFVIIQVIMIGFPGIAMRYNGPVVNTSHIIFKLPEQGGLTGPGVLETAWAAQRRLLDLRRWGRSADDAAEFRGDAHGPLAVISRVKPLVSH